MTPTVRLRPALDGDLEAVAGLLSLTDPDGVDASELREELHTLPSGKVLRLTVAVSDDVIGASSVRRFPSEPPGAFHVAVAVERPRRRRGAGTRLFEDAAAFAAGCGATRLLSVSPDSEPGGPEFARRVGMVEVAHAVLLEGPAGGRSVDGAREAALRARGIGVSSFAEQPPGERSDRCLYEINRIAAVDDPGSLTGSYPSYDRWLRIVRQAPWFQPEGQFVAIADDRFVGLASVSHEPGAEVADALIAGVAAEYRGLGIAQALKARTLAFVAARGGVTIRTQVDSGNSAMLHISRKLGFDAVGGLRSYERSLLELETSEQAFRRRSPRGP